MEVYELMIAIKDWRLVVPLRMERNNISICLTDALLFISVCGVSLHLLNIVGGKSWRHHFLRSRIPLAHCGILYFSSIEAGILLSYSIKCATLVVL